MAVPAVPLAIEQIVSQSFPIRHTAPPNRSVVGIPYVSAVMSAAVAVRAQRDCVVDGVLATDRQGDPVMYFEVSRTIASLQPHLYANKAMTNLLCGFPMAK